MNSSFAQLRPGWMGMAAIYLAFAAVVVRSFGIEANRAFIAQYVTLEAVYIILFTLALWQHRLPAWLMHLYLACQSVLVLWMLSLRPQFDFVVLLFLLLTYPVSLAFTGRVRWIWIGNLVCLTSGSLMFYLGILRGLALSLTTIAAEIVLPAYTSINREIELARMESQSLLEDLQAAHQKSQLYAQQVGDLAAMQERNRLARELHDTVSQLIFSISLTTRSAQLLLDKDPQRVSEQLHNLKAMTGDALGQLRSLITQLRPPRDPEQLKS